MAKDSPQYIYYQELRQPEKAIGRWIGQAPGKAVPINSYQFCTRRIAGQTSNKKDELERTRPECPELEDGYLKPELACKTICAASR